MLQSTTDRNLLFGILALQMDFIARDALIAAMHAWVLEKAKPLGQILLEQKALTADTHALLEALVQKHLALHGNDAERSLAAVSSVGSVRNDLEQIADPDVQASLVHVAADPFATVAPPSVGASTSGGLRFRILRPHARGGLGEVFVAHDEELHREVALKEIQNKHADHPESRARFLLEAEITGGLEHPGIVPVYGLGTYADGRPFYAMRFIRGDSLQDAIKRYHQGEPGSSATGERTLELRKLLGRLIDVCNALQYAHDRGVLHRDIKPGNIMLGKYGETLVVDWGLAKALGEPGASATGEKTSAAGGEAPLNPSNSSGSAETIAGTAIGTPAYMSPEQAEGRLDLLGPASDVYSLGATLYCLLTGKPPVEGKDIADVLRKVQKGEFPSPRQVKRDADPALEAICLTAMALNPADRYVAPQALADDIEHWLADEPVAAWLEPALKRAARWMRHHKPLVTGMAAAVLVGLTALTTGGIWYQNAQAELARKVSTQAAYFVLKSTAYSVQNRIDDFHERHQSEAARLANSPAFKSFARTPGPDRASAIFRQDTTYLQMMVRNLDATYQAYDGIYQGQLLALGILDSSGKVLTKSSGLNVEQIDLKSFVYRYLQKAVTDASPTISDLYYASEVGGQAAIAYVAPIQSREQGVVGLVVIWVKAEFLWKILHEFNKFSHYCPVEVLLVSCKFLPRFIL